MESIILEPLRWMEESARISILAESDTRKSRLQVTGWRDVSRTCVGRPAEELPRMLTVLSPSHHLVSAMALDRLFNVEPPELAVTMREALLQALYFTHHLRKLYSLLCVMEDPFLCHPVRAVGATQSLVPHRLLDRIMDHVGLCQEAATILGGRPDHPVSALAGGVGRFLKEPHYSRLSEISDACLCFALELTEFLGETFFESNYLREKYFAARLPPMFALSMENGSDAATFSLPGNSSGDTVSADRVFDTIAFHREPWTYKPFAYVREQGWKGLESENQEGLFFVGPLARLNQGAELPSPRAEEARQRLFDSEGPFPRLTVEAAYRALVVELVQAAERLCDLCVQKKLTGPAIRVIPTSLNLEAVAALESPQGLIAHRYKTDERGLVQEIQILDASVANNALRCMLVRDFVEKAPGSLGDLGEIKKRIEVSLLPF
jgi:F420-non-reducing hydrogenase large subunit